MMPWEATLVSETGHTFQLAVGSELSLGREDIQASRTTCSRRQLVMRLSTPNVLMITRVGEGLSQLLRRGGVVPSLIEIREQVELHDGDSIFVCSRNKEAAYPFMFNTVPAQPQAATVEPVAQPAPQQPVAEPVPSPHPCDDGGTSGDSDPDAGFDPHDLDDYPCGSGRSYDPQPGCTSVCCKGSCARRKKKPRPLAPDTSRSLADAESWLRSLDPKLCGGGKTAAAVAVALSRAYPLRHRDEANSKVAAAMTKMEKYEIALQGDDYTDKTEQKTNHEALSYARAAATVRGLPWSLSSLSLGSAPSRAAATAQLRREPFIGEFRTAQIIELLRTGRCSQLTDFEANQAPISSQGVRRLVSARGKSLTGARDKLEVSRVLGISAIRAAEMHEGSYQPGLLPPIRGIAAMRALGEQHRAVLGLQLESEVDEAMRLGLRGPSTALADLAGPAEESAQGGAGLAEEGGGAQSRSTFSLGLQYYDELQEPVPTEEAHEMLNTVREAVRRQQQGEAGCARAVEGHECRCCWHAEFVGGARRRGQPGHDADILIFHHAKPASWGRDRGENVLAPLVTELTDRRLLVGPSGWRMLMLKHASRRQLAHRRDVSQTSSTTHGFENLTMDHHDKVSPHYKKGALPFETRS